MFGIFSKLLLPFVGRHHSGKYFGSLSPGGQKQVLKRRRARQLAKQSIRRNRAA